MEPTKSDVIVYRQFRNKTYWLTIVVFYMHCFLIRVSLKLINLSVHSPLYLMFQNNFGAIVNHFIGFNSFGDKVDFL